MGADGGMDGGGTDRREEEAAVSKLSLEGNRDRNRWQRISRRAKFSPENSCLSFQALKGCREAGQNPPGCPVHTQTWGFQHSRILKCLYHISSPFSSETKVLNRSPARLSRQWFRKGKDERSLYNRGKSSGDDRSKVSPKALAVGVSH